MFQFKTNQVRLRRFIEFFFLKWGQKELCLYIDIGGANIGLARANKIKKRGKKPPKKREKRSAYKLRQVFSTGKNPILSLLPNLVHDDRRQRGFIVEDSFIPFFPNLPSDKQDGGP
jgi:hypothetical protein